MYSALSAGGAPDGSSGGCCGPPGPNAGVEALVGAAQLGVDLVDEVRPGGAHDGGGGDREHQGDQHRSQQQAGSERHLEDPVAY